MQSAGHFGLSAFGFGFSRGLHLFAGADTGAADDARLYMVALRKTVGAATRVVQNLNGS